MGDIFLEDLRAFRDRLLAHVGLDGCYPLWGIDSEELFREFCDLGFQAVVVCVDLQQLTADHCGRLLTPAFRASLPEGADACGERGKYHSFAFDGPLFRNAVAYRLGEVHRQGPFAFQELYPRDFTSPRGPDGGLLTLAPIESTPPAHKPAMPHAP